MKKRMSSTLQVCLYVFALLTVISLSGCNRSLRVAITGPQNNDSFLWGETVTFRGTAVNADGSTLEGLQLTWTSDRDGLIGRGGTCAYRSLSAGRHTITLTAVDAQNAAGSDRIRITVTDRTGLIIRDSDYTGRDYRGAVWTSLTVRSRSGALITGMSLDDFQLTEEIVARADGTVKAAAEIDITQFIGDDWSEGGFWEDSRGGEPIDIVIAYDATGTMSDYVEAAREELIALVDDLKANHVDFRMAAVTFGEAGIYERFGFYGPQETDLLVEQIEYWLSRTGGDWWSPTMAYDAVMFTPWYGFRDEARKVCVVLNDLVPQTVYGTFWYPGGCTAATASAMELFLQETGIELYYCQHTGYDLTDVDYQFYMDDEINPRAGDAESGFVSLKDPRGNPLATPLAWPFSRRNFMETLGITSPRPVKDSLYLLAWESAFDLWEAVPGGGLVYHPEDYELRVTIEVPDPDNPGGNLTAACTFPIEKQWKDTALTLVLTDEEGTPVSSDLWASIYHLMGERKILEQWQLGPRKGKIEVIYLPLGSTYHVAIQDGSYTYESIRAVLRENFIFSESGMAVDMEVSTADKTAELCKARGLLKDIEDWQGIGDPFQDMVDSAHEWLDELEADGVSWLDMAQIKRFYITLSGYANIIYYSQRQAEGAIHDFTAIVQNFRDIVEQVKKMQEDTTEDWLRELASILIEIVDVIITRGEFTIQKELLDEALNRLLDYAAEKLTVDLREKIIEQFPLGDYSELLKQIVNYLIDAAFGDGTSEPDWEGVFQAVKALTMDRALETVKEKAGGALIDAALDRALRGTIGDDNLTRSVKRLVRDIIEALMGNNMENDFSRAFETFARGMADHVAGHGNDTLVAVVNKVFDAVDTELKAAGAPVDLREFLVGMARELALNAIPKVEGGSVSFRINTDQVVAVLIKYGVYYVILKDYFIDEINRGLEETLKEARNHVPEGGERYDWRLSMYRVFWDYRKLIGQVQDTAWDALRTQEALTEWARQMQELCDILKAISEPLDFLANIWPDLKKTAENVHAFIAVLDGFQILANAISFGLKVDCLDTFGNMAEPMYQTVFPRG